MECASAIAGCDAAAKVKSICQNFDAYLITEIDTGLAYVGITRRGVGKRWAAHLASARRGSSLFFHRVVRRRGAAAFCVQHVACASTEQSLRELERALIAQYCTLWPQGFNLTAGGQGTLGHKFTAEQLERLSRAHLGIKQTPETKKKISIASTGRRHTEVTKAKMSAVRKSLYKDPVFRAAVAERLVALSKSQKRRTQIRQTFFRLMENPTFSAMWRAGHTGHAHSIEAKIKMRHARISYMSKNPRHGELAGKLTVGQVAEIKALLLAGHPPAKIAVRFGVGQTQISNIKHGLCWRGVAPANVETPLIPA